MSSLPNPDTAGVLITGATPPDADEIDAIGFAYGMSMGSIDDEGSAGAAAEAAEEDATTEGEEEAEEEDKEALSSEDEGINVFTRFNHDMRTAKASSGGNPGTILIRRKFCHIRLRYRYIFPLRNRKTSYQVSSRSSR